MGLISPELAAVVDEAYNRSLTPSQRKRRVKPTVYQVRNQSLLPSLACSCFLKIRLGGSKGLVSIDATLGGKVVHLRPSMTKFDAKALTLDICGDNPRRLPAFLNRPLIKLLEDLGVAPSVFFDLQQSTLDEIEQSKKSFHVGSKYVEELGLAQASKLAQTLRLLAQRLPRRNACEPCPSFLPLETISRA